MKTKQKYEAFMFPNGVTAFCVDGEQKPELQHPWLLSYVDFLEGSDSSIDVTQVLFHMPNGGTAHIIRFEDGTYNLKFEG